MNCETFIRLSNKTGVCQISKLKEVVISLTSSYAEYEEDKEERLTDLIVESLAIQVWAGSIDDYHNFSVWFATQSAPNYVLASMIVKKGLEQYPKSVDLLADFLQYGSKCSGQQQTCEECYNTLQSINRDRWNWRAYAFSIDYLVSRIENGYDEDADDCMLAKQLADEFVEAFPNDERSYVSKGELLRDGTDEKRLVYEKGCSMSGKAPRCLLHLAEIYFENKEYEKMLDALQKCQIDALEVQNSVNVGYVYVLLTLCRLALFYINNNHLSKLSPEINEQINLIHRDYKSAKVFEITISERINDLKKQIDVLEKRTGVSFESDY